MKTRKGNVFLTLALAGFLAFGSPSPSANAAWKTTPNGKIYTQTKAPGYLTGMKKIGSNWYYFNKNGIMQTGFHTLANGATYYFNANGTRRTGWLSLTSGGTAQRYYFDENGIMATGIQTIDKVMYYFSPKGVMRTGWITAADKKTRYYADKTGALAVSRWVGSYYFYSDGKLATNTWIEGKYVGANGKATGATRNYGWITKGSSTYYYDAKGNKVKGWLQLEGKLYYLNPSTGALQKGWLTIGGRRYYAGPAKGVILRNQWFSGKYLKNDGSVAVGWTSVGSDTYYFSISGAKQTGWITYKNHTYYFGSNGKLVKDEWISTGSGMRYVNKYGYMLTGFRTVGKYVYYFNENGIRQLGFVTVNGKTYYLIRTNGHLAKKTWILNNMYYANSSGALLKGLNAIKGALYYFDTTTGKKIVNSKIAIGNDTYYFQADGSAVKSKWVRISGKYYYFYSSGKLAKSTWVGKYYVDATGARTDRQKQTGWVTADGKKYYFDKEGNMIRSRWLYFNGGNDRYYAGADGAMVTGIQTIGGKKYYFYPEGTLARGTTIDVATKRYTINDSGVIISEESIKIPDDSRGAEIANFALQYVGNPYVYGGTSLTNGADCSGFVQTVFAHFGITLLRVADDQMHGPSSYYIGLGYKPATVVSVSEMKPGDLVFYGSGNYASHVAIYIGNGQIVHASNSQPYPKGGIKVSPYNYQTPIRIVRYWN